MLQVLCLSLSQPTGRPFGNIAIFYILYFLECRQLIPHSWNSIRSVIFHFGYLDKAMAVLALSLRCPNPAAEPPETAEWLNRKQV